MINNEIHFWIWICEVCYTRHTVWTQFLDNTQISPTSDYKKIYVQLLILTSPVPRYLALTFQHVLFAHVCNLLSAWNAIVWSCCACANANAEPFATPWVEMALAYASFLCCSRVCWVFCIGNLPSLWWWFCMFILFSFSVQSLCIATAGLGSMVWTDPCKTFFLRIDSSSRAPRLLPNHSWSHNFDPFTFLAVLSGSVNLLFLTTTFQIVHGSCWTYSDKLEKDSLNGELCQKWFQIPWAHHYPCKTCWLILKILQNCSCVFFVRLFLNAVNWFRKNEFPT